MVNINVVYKSPKPFLHRREVHFFRDIVFKLNNKSKKNGNEMPEEGTLSFSLTAEVQDNFPIPLELFHKFSPA